jgi:demethoxyubiquinone hydroxylase (CLK1/Coq7/Cat5 family)
MSKSKQAFGFAISDAKELISCFDTMNAADCANQPPEVLKRASLIMTLTAWETYVEDVASELIETKYAILMGSQVGNIINNRLEDHLKVFNNPDSKKAKELFFEFFDIDVTESWVWGN